MVTEWESWEEVEAVNPKLAGECNPGQVRDNRIALATFIYWTADVKIACDYGIASTSTSRPCCKQVGTSQTMRTWFPLYRPADHFHRRNDQRTLE